MIRVLGAQFSKINRFSNELSNKILINSHQTDLNVDFVRKLSTSSCTQFKSKAEEIAERKRKDQEIRWTKLYHFKNMKYHSILTRLKIYPLLTGVIGTPISFGIEMSQVIPEFTYIPCLVISKFIFITLLTISHQFIISNNFFRSFKGLTGTVMLSIYSAAIANTIGIVYMCQENKNVQIAYVDFWGKQRFLDSSVEVMHKCEKSKVKFGLYKTLHIKSDTEQKTLKLPWDTGDIFDIKVFRRCFGK